MDGATDVQSGRISAGSPGGDGEGDEHPGDCADVWPAPGLRWPRADETPVMLNFRASETLPSRHSQRSGKVPNQPEVGKPSNAALATMELADEEPREQTLLDR